MAASEPVASVLVLDDEPSSVELLQITLELDYRVFTATDGETALRILADQPDTTVAIIDQRMPGMSGTEFIQRTIEPYPHLSRIILTGYTDVEALIEAINAGRVFRYLTKPWDRDELLATVRQAADHGLLARDNARLTAELADANDRLRRDNARLRSEARERWSRSEIVGGAEPLREALQLIDRVIPTDSTVLILGETGTGKDLMARAIHYSGPRREKPFVTENCGAIAPELLTSELFGHKKGSFTGADEDRKGLFEMADGGTIFLDEIGDCPAALQTQLLRVLDHGEIRRVGDNRPIPVDVRVIAATHHDLEADVAAGKFRQDLFYRLNVFTVRAPALRDRISDLPLLAEHFVQRLNRSTDRQVRGLTPDAFATLAHHPFPGNVRELENDIERAFVLADDGSYITPDLLAPKHKPVGVPQSTGSGGGLRAAVESYEAKLLREALGRNDGVHTRTAADLEISRRTLFDKLRKYGIK